MPLRSTGYEPLREAQTVVAGEVGDVQSARGGEEDRMAQVLQVQQVWCVPFRSYCFASAPPPHITQHLATGVPRS